MIPAAREDTIQHRLLECAEDILGKTQTKGVAYRAWVRAIICASVLFEERP